MEHILPQEGLKLLKKTSPSNLQCYVVISKPTAVSSSLEVSKSRNVSTDIKDDQVITTNLEEIVKT